jgi:predicted DNA-binding WGR domain protein
MNNSMFGRYEYRGGGSNKFWHIVCDLSTQTCTASWGRIGNSPQNKKYSLAEGKKKIMEKIKKGYVKVKGYEETIGCTSLHYILTDEVA